MRQEENLIVNDEKQGESLVNQRNLNDLIYESVHSDVKDGEILILVCLY